MSAIAKLSNLTTTYASYRKTAETCSYPPLRVWVEASSHCNLSCSFCGNRLLSADQRGHMDLDLFRRLADEASGVINQFNMFHRGESLMHPAIGEMLWYARKKGIRTRIHTNGTLLNHNLARELIESGLDVLSFSFDGYDREMYDANRPNAGFDRVLGNILGLLNMKKKLGVEKPFVALELMEISDRPPAQLRLMRRDFLRRFEELPLDKFIIRKPHNWGGLVNIGKIASNRHKVACPLLWHALVVLWDGQVLPCPQDFFGQMKLGKVPEQKLLDIWNGEEIRGLRREMSDLKSLERKPCVDCDRILRSTIAGIPTDYLGRFISEALPGNRWIGKILPH